MTLPSTPLPSFEDLSFQSGTFRAYTVSGTGRHRKYGARRGVLTKLGDIEIDEWRTMMLALIQRSGEMSLYEQLLRWCKDHNYCHQTRQELEDAALKLHSLRIFENPNWVGYEEFNCRYCSKAK